MENALLAIILNIKLIQNYIFNFQVEKVVSPDICIWPDTEFKKQLRKLGVIQDKLVKKTNSVFQIIDFQTQKALNNAYIEVITKINLIIATRSILEKLLVKMSKKFL